MFQVSSKILKYLSLERVGITYSPNTKKITFKFDSGAKKYTITQSGNRIERLYIGTQNMLSTPIEIQKLTQYLP
jgi:hypothetical protein